MSQSRTIRLVHITTVPQTLGFLVGQVSFMRAQGFEVHCISSPGQYLIKFAKKEEVMTHEIEMSRRITPCRDIVSLIRMCSKLLKIRPTIVHSHTPKSGLLAMIAAFFCNVPVRIYHIHGLPFMTAKGYKRFLLKLTEYISCKLAHQVLCVSNSIREVAIFESICDPNKLKVLCNGSINGVDSINRFNLKKVGKDTRNEVIGKYNIPLEALVIGYVGRVVRDKGLTELTNAWRILKRIYPHVYLLVVGEFEPHDPLPSETKKILLEDPHIRLTGHLEDVSKIYAVLDLLVLPSYREGFPVVPLEAAAMEVPVVATRIPGCIDVIKDGVTGILVPPNDICALVEAIKFYINDPKLREKHGRNARNCVLIDFRQEIIWEAQHKEYLRLLIKRF